MHVCVYVSVYAQNLEILFFTWLNFEAEKISVNIKAFINIIFLLWKSVENDEPLLDLLIPSLISLTLIFCTLLYFLNLIYIRFESFKG